MIELVTERMRVVQAAPQFSDACAAYARRNREYHRPWSPAREAAYYEPAYWRDRLSTASDAFAKGAAYSFLIVPNDAPQSVAGEINFSNVVRGSFHACHLGYALDEAYAGRGFMREALIAALGFIFEETGLHRVMANYMPANERSGSLLRRLGFHIEGYARDYLFLNGAWRDHVLTALHADEWLSR